MTIAHRGVPPGSVASRCRSVVMFTALWCACGTSGRGADIDGEPISYATAAPRNLVGRLQKRLEAGEAKLAFDDDHGYLRSLLRELDVPESSQMLVFSKTSLQRHRIGPKTPRALYFNDEVYVGFCLRGDVLEITAADPQLGAVFYTLDQTEPRRPRITRQTDACLSCHSSSQTQGFPGHVVRSVYSDPRGQPILSAGSHRIDHTSPLAERWGGWYVTGTTGRQMHLGNLIIDEKDHRPEASDNTTGVNVTSLGGQFTVASYPTPHSDLVALMVLEHQAEMHNRLTRANFQTRMALRDESALNEALGRPAGERSPSTLSRIKSAGEPLVKYLLFSGETALTDKLEGTSAFAREFAERGPRDRRGRSLRDFDLERRLFKYPCSYLIYSEVFDALPAPVREYALRRIWEVLTDQDTCADFAHLSPADRRAILEILRDTKPNLPAYWRQAVGNGGS